LSHHFLVINFTKLKEYEKKLIPDSGSKKPSDPRSGSATLVILDGKRQKMHTCKSTHLSMKHHPRPRYTIYFLSSYVYFRLKSAALFLQKNNACSEQNFICNEDVHHCF
jgi:hypothetical protein